MTIYSIEKHGSDYVVKADDQGLMIVGSRRRAAQLVIDASELLVDAPTPPAPHASSQPAEPTPSQRTPADPGAAAASSISRDGPEVA